MNSYRKIIVLILCLFPATLWAQEICDDGIDNDGNGFIDCYDNACSGTDACDDFYFGNAVLCQDPATQSPAFDISLQWASDELTAFNSMTPAIGDLTRNGTPEVVVTNRELNTLTVLRGSDGVTLKGPLNVGFDIAKTVAIANLDDDECGEIFVRGFNNGALRAYDCNLNLIWSKTVSGNKVNLISLADFNGDGQVELLHGNEIRNAHTGDVIVAKSGNFSSEVIYGSLAVDILPDAACADCSGLEIVAGSKIYSVNIGTKTRTLVRDMNDIDGVDFAIKYSGWNKNAAAVADYNQDGNIDVVFSGGQNVSGSLKAAAFFWDVANSTVTTFIIPQNHNNATGRINIADIDGDGKLNCTFVSKQRLYALDENMTPLTSWNGGKGYKDITEGSSGFTGCTVFDFNDDKAAEVIYRGEKYVHIIDGKTGVSLKQIFCTSRTYEEYPIVADVDGDGASEICVSCSYDNNTPFSPYSLGQYAHIRVFEAGGGENWQPSRPIWNQHGYFNVNINDDLTIPIIQQDPGKVFSSNVCTTGENRPLNAFLNQAPYLDESGCPSYISPDIEFIEVTSVGSAQCPEGDFPVSLKIRNTGDTDMTGALPITFYNGAPDLASSVKLNTVYVELINFNVGTDWPVNETVKSDGGDFDLYISINDNGSQNPPVSNFVRPIPECDDSNNISFTSVTAQNFDLQHEIISHNVKCDDDALDNGDARVYYYGTISETITTLWSENFDNLAEGTEIDNGSTAWEFTTAPSGANKLEVSFTGTSNKLVFAGVSNSATAVWESEAIDISGQESAKISLSLSSSSNLENSGDGKDFIEVYYVIDGDQEAMTNGIHVAETGTVVATAENITGSSLKIRIKAKNNTNDELYYVDDILIEGVKDPQNGEITAGFNFYWFQNNNFNDTIYVGNRYSALADGNYQVVGASQSNSCISNVEHITIEKQENPPTIGIDVISNLNNCESPNGELQAYAIVNGVKVTSGFSFFWTIASDPTTPVSITATAENLLDRTYQVTVTDDISGCFSNATQEITTDQIKPNLREESIVHITDCTNSASGSITVSSGSDGSPEVNGYTFNWYNGNGVKLVPDYTASGAAGATYDNLEPGDYMVEVQDESSKCISDPILFTVLDNSTSPDIVVSPTNSTSCTENGNGLASAEIFGRDIDDYIFTYYKGSNALPANKITTVSGTQQEVAQLLSAGQYLVTAEEIGVGCVGRANFTIADDSVEPITLPVDAADKIVIANIVSCNGVLDTTSGIIDASGIDPADVDTDEFEAIQNGSFEVPNIQTEFGSSTYKIFDQALADGWSSTDGVLEYWRSGFNGVPSLEGNQFAEINANNPGAFYFDVVTKPGVRMNWSFGHRGRSGVDEMALQIDDPAAVNPTEIGRFSTDKNAWAVYSGDYTIPAGQTISRFSFKAISTAGNSLSVGNFIDDIVFEVADYYFQLFSGNSSTGTPIAENTTGIFDGLDKGTYTLSVINNITGCPAKDIVVNVKVNEQAPLLVRQLKESDDYCVGGNGSQQIKVTTEGTEANDEPVNGYKFEIYPTADTTTTPYSTPVVVVGGEPSTTYKFTDLEENPNYRILVINRDNGCSSYTDISIVDDSEIPSFSAPITVDNTSCDPASPTGSIIANVFGEPKSEYTWSWLDDSGLPISPDKTDADGAADGTANNLTNIAGGTYQVHATHTLTGCVTGWLSVTIDDDPSGEFTTLTLTQEAENTSCTVGNGQLKVLIDDGNGTPIDPPADHTVEWFIGPDATGTQLIDGVDPGNNSMPVIAGANENEVSGLNAPSGNNTYTVRVTNATACANTATISITNAPVQAIIAANNVTEVQTCVGSVSHPEGAIEITSMTEAGNPTAVGDYDYTWYFGSSNDPTKTLADGDNIGTKKGMTAVAITVSDATTNHIKGLNAGFYTVEAINKTTGCTSDAVTIEVTENFVSFSATLDGTGTDDNTVCSVSGGGDYDGQITMTPSAGVASDYTWEWFAGLNDNAGNEIATIVPTATVALNVLSEIPGGDYTARITNNTSQCAVLQSFSINDNQDKPGSTATPTTSATPVSECDGGTGYANGSVTVETIDGNPVAGTGDYSYEWYWGNSVDPAKILTTDGSITIFDAAHKNDATKTAAAFVLETDNVLSGLNQGSYTVVATSTATGCVADPVTIEVVETLIPITATLDGVGSNDNTVCDLATATNYDGQITVIPGPDAIGDYTWEWFAGLNVNAANAIATAVPSADASVDGVLSLIPGGDYTLRLTNNTTNCENTFSFNINDDQDKPGSTATPTTSATPVSECDGGTGYANGSVTVETIDGNPVAGTGDYSYEWYWGNSVDPAKILTTDGSITIFDAAHKNDATKTAAAFVLETDNVLSGLNQGSYTVVATSTATGCVADPVTIEVVETLIPITATLDGAGSNDNTVCDLATATNYDGQITVTPGPDAVGDYTWEWFAGLNVNAANAIATAVPSADASVDGVLSLIPGGDYTLRLTNNTTNCENTFSFNINDDQDKPGSTTTPTTSATPVSECDGGTGYANGSVTLETIDGNPVAGTGDYSYEWYWGNSVDPAKILTTDGSITIFDAAHKNDATKTAAAFVLETDNVLSGLNQGSYTVVATSTATGCVADPVTIEVVETLIPITATLDGAGSNDNTVCDLATATNYDGQITVTPGPDAVGDYTWEWFAGLNVNAANAIATAVPSADASIDGVLSLIPGGDYTLRLTNNTTNCENTFSFNINDDQDKPGSTTTPTTSATPVSECDGGTGYANGSVTLETIDGNPVAGTGDYSYEWYWGNSVDPAKILTTDGSITIFDAAHKNDATKTAAAFVLETDNVLSGLNQGSYTVVATSTATGCVADPVTIEVVETLIPITATLDGAGSNDNTVCDLATATNYDGQITVTPGPDAVGDYTWEWFAGLNVNAANAIATAVPSADASVDGVLSLIPGGDYTLRLTNNTTNCENTFSFNINDDQDKPGSTTTPTTSATPVSECDGGTGYANGSVTLETIDGNPVAGTGDYSYEWYWGNSVDPAKILTTDGSITIFDAAHKNDATKTAAAFVLETDNVLSGLNQGSYTVVATSTATGCVADPVTIEVVETLIPITATLDGAGSNDNTVCDLATATNYDGQITVTPGPDAVGDYTWEWFAGLNVNAANAIATAVPSADASVDGVLSLIPGGDYTLRLTNNTTNCENTFSFNINDDQDKPGSTTTPTTSATPVSECDGGTGYANGSVTLETIDGNPVAGTGDYSYEWYWGNSVDPAKILTTDGSITIFDAAHKNDATKTAAAFVLETDNVLSGLNQGSYTVVATSTATGCVADPVTIEVVETLIPITATLDGAGSNDNTVCDLATATNYDGQITVTPGPDAVGDYTWEWFAGLNVNAANAIATAVPSADASVDGVLSLIPGGDYTLRLTNNTTNCENTFSFNINDNETKPVITNAVLADVAENNNTACIGAATYPNGSIQLNNLTGTGTYTFEWYYGTSIDAAKLIADGTNILDQKGTGTGSGVVADATTNHILNLDAGDYTVRSIDQGTGCVSDPITITIGDDIPAIVIDAVVDRDDYSCDIATPTGKITADVNGGNTGYLIDWYLGTNILGASLQQTDEATNTLDNLSSGTYTVKVTNKTTFCYETAQVTIIRTLPIITVTGSDIDQTTCAPNGSATATPQAITYTNGTPRYDGGTGIPTTYTYEWYEGQDDSTTPLAEVSATLGSQVAGFYTVVATNTAAGCESSVLTIEIGDGVSANAPVADIRALGTQPISGITGNIPGSCNANDGIIIANITANANGNELALSWYGGSDDYTDGSGTELTTNSTNVNGTGTSAYAALGATGAGNGYPSGLYSLLMEDLVTGCIYQQVFDLPFNGQQATTTLSVEHVEQCPDDGVAKVGMGDNITITYNTLAGTFSDGEEVTAPSGATGIVGFDNGAHTMQISSTTNPSAFSIGDVITGSFSTASATIDGISGIGNEASSVDDITNYDIYLFVGDGVPAGYTPVHQVIPGNTVLVGEEVEFTGLPAGTYTAVARERTGVLGGGECYSAASTDEILQNAYAPLIDSYSITENTICDPVTYTGNGSITVTARKNAADTTQTKTDHFTFTWYKVGAENPGDELQAADENVTTSTLLNQAPGDYIVYIDRLGLVGPAPNGCQLIATYTIQDNPELHEITGVDVATIVDCDGTSDATITDALITDAAANYTYTWYKGTYPGGIIALENGPTLAGQTEGTYFVEATENVTKGCTTSVFEFEIEKDVTPPALTLTVTTEDSYCLSGDQGNGVVTWSIGAPTDNYTYQWYKGASATPGQELTDVTITGKSGTDVNITGDVLSNVNAGTYTIEVTDVTSPPNNACSSIATIVVPDATPTISINDPAADYTLTHKLNCSNTGSFEILQVKEDGIVTGNLSDYNFTYTKQDDTAAGGSLSGTNNNIISDLSEGDYKVVISSIASTCTSSEFFFTIEDQSVDPTIDFTVNAVDTFCGDPITDGGNGSITATVQGGAPSSDYTFEWFYGSGTTTTLAASGIVSQTATAGTASGLPQGTYTLRVTDNNPNNATCQTISEFVLTEDQPVISINDPAADYTLTHKLNCSNTGSFEVLQVKEDGVVSFGLASYTYTFARQSGDPLGVTPSGLNGQTIAGLDADDYQVTITNKNSDCASSIFYFTIEDQSVDPTIDFTVNAVDTFCGDPVTEGGNGSITATVQGGTPIGDYTYEWFYGAQTTTPLDNTQIASYVAGATDNIATGLPQGTYTLRVTDNTDPNNTCQTTSEFVLTEDQPVITINDPAADYTLTHKLNCTNTGSFEISQVKEDGIVTGALGDYNFTYTKQDGTAAGGTLSGTNNSIISGLEEGDYKVVIENDASTCSSSEFYFTIEDQSVDPTIDFTVNAVDTFCGDPVTEGGNGSITATVQGGAPIGNYTYEWFYGAQTTTPLDNTQIASYVAGATNNIATGLPQGTYTLRVTDNTDPNNTCQTTSEFVLTEDQPVITINDPAADYTLTHKLNCTNTGSFEISQVKEDGIVTGALGDYNFTYTKQDGTAAGGTLSGTNNSIISGLEEGDYKVVIENDASTCSSSEFYFTIEDQSVDPTIDFTVNAVDTFCGDPVTEGGNGSITATVQGGAPIGNYTYEWFYGAQTTTPLDNTQIASYVAGATNNIATGLPQGTYTLRVTDNTDPNNTCQTTSEFVLTEDQPVITINDPAADYTLTHKLNCTNTGSFEISQVKEDGIVTGALGDYNFTYTKQDGTAAGGTLSGTNNSIISGLEEGDYKVVIENDASTCSSSEFYFTIEDQSVDPTIDFTVNAVDTFCGDPVTEGGNGSITATVQGGTPIGDYTYEWFYGAQTTTPLDNTQIASYVAGATDNIATGLPQGTYTLRVTDNTDPNNTCQTTSEFVLTEDQPVITINDPAADYTLTHKLNCTNTGSFEISQVKEDGIVTGALGDYNFTYTKQDGTAAGGTLSGTNNSIISGLEEGDYKVVIENDASTCSSSEFYFTIEDQSVDPTIDFTVNAVDTFCGDPVTEGGNGSITATVQGGAPIGDYTYEWFYGAQTTTPLDNTQIASYVAGATDNIATGLPQGTYTLRVTDNTDPNNTCQTTSEFVLTEDQPVVSISASEYTLTDKTNCSNDGSFEITDVLEDGIAQGLADYTFTYEVAGGGALPVASTPSMTGLATDDNRIDDLPAGDYQVTISSDISTCSSSTFLFTIEDTTVDPVAILTSKTPDTNCTTPTPEDGNGTLTVALQGGAAVADYDYTWYRGSIDPANNITLGNKVGSAVIGGVGESLTGLAPGQYVLVIEDSNGDDANDGCSSTATFTITNTPTTITIDDANVDTGIVHVTDCNNNNGSITLTDADVNPGVLADYDFTWYTDGPLTDMGLAANTTAITSQSPGQYYVKATHKATGCNSGQIGFVIENQAEPATIVITENTPDTSCDPDANEGNGALDWTIGDTDGGVAPAGDYTYQWYVGGSVATGTILTDGATITGATGTVSGPYTGTISGLDAGVYTLLITDTSTPNSTCTVESTFKLSESITTYEITASSLTNNTHCEDNLTFFSNGEFEITTITGGALADFTYTFVNKDDAGYVFNNVADGHVDQLDPGSYEVTVEHTSNQCILDVFDFEIEDESVTPSLTFTLDQADQYCVGGNGELTAATDATTPTYTWDHGPATAQVTGLDNDFNADGEYTVTVQDGITGCTVTGSFIIPLKSELIDIDMTAVNITDASCSTSTDGSVEITTMSPDTNADYDFAWYKDTYPSLAIAGQFTATLSNQTPGTYYAEATSTISGCTSGVFEFEIGDLGLNPIITQVYSQKQFNCDLGNPNGVLKVMADSTAGANQADYTFAWSSPLGTPAPAAGQIYSGLGEGNYNIEVTNIATGCVSTESLPMVNDINFPLVLGLSADGNDNCIDENGQLVINVLNSKNPTAVFNYYLYSGELANPGFVAANQLGSSYVDDLVHGKYTVMVEDIDGGCESEPNYVEIEDFRNTGDMAMNIVQNHALTKCDLTRADGEATITPLPKTPSTYTIYWHDGSSLSDPILDSALNLNQLVDKTYAIEMTDRYTGCMISDNITISNEALDIPTPLITVLQDRMNCITPDGAISAEVDSTVVGYAFEWQDASDAVISSTFSASGLDIGEYSVKATSLSTGCVSDEATVQVTDARVDPSFTVITTESRCSEVSEFGDGYAGNGEAVLAFDHNTSIENQYWAVDNGIEIDPADASTIISTNEQMSGLSPGEYRVLVTDVNDCSYEASFVIATDIEIFNGVSDNGDGLNDYFRISCADRFPSNHVKIYTRSGTLVYETDGYEDDVTGNVFTGKRNTGLGGGSDGLPSGTYFYIFDKGEGQEGDVYQGYLELVR
ncbi:gliding motility-associated C-terminal domain-containing protein [Reichenbachiella carrageenanivorans]|uniref:Gliding motility-associated C-terminal domain-containing protein n=1 Tax=Reichenbachiella carrageenanivorans TaxID=2979869 RepID=A0ABY6CYY2_9BACT|nr:gliding motility-associated C-terminal domain-containing protein [Reichenbachiella carrageenanivorans]UXX78924.1 gliding motility-associated C-terminal domain-containing protein [Reichenbachiella carrageenanivorans]